MGEINAKAEVDALEDVSIKGDELKITPLKAITPEAAEEAAKRLYAMTPNVRITSVLADVHRWTGVRRRLQPTCIRACQPTTPTSCSPPCSPMPPTSA